MNKKIFFLICIVFFSTANALSTNVNYPNGGEYLLWGTPNNILFSYSSTDFNADINANIYYSVVSGARENTITTNYKITPTQFKNSDQYLIEGWHFDDSNVSNEGNPVDGYEPSTGCNTAINSTISSDFSNGIIGKGCDFNGHQAVGYATTDFNIWAGSVALWFKRDPITNITAYETYFNSGISGQAGCSVQLTKYYNQQDDLGFYVSCDYAREVDCASTTAWDSFDNKWHYLVGTWDINHAFDGNTCRFYVDGNLIRANDTVNNSKREKAITVNIGANNPAADNAVYGIMDEVQLFSRPLTTAQILDKYNRVKQAYINCPNYDGNASHTNTCGYPWTLPSNIATNDFFVDVNVNNGTTTAQDSSDNPVHIIPDSIAPTLKYTINKTYGFGVDLNIPYTLQCSGDRNNLFTYDVNLNGTNILHRQDLNGTIDVNSVVVSNGSPIFVFSCTNISGLQTSVTVQPFNVVNFILINEVDGNAIGTYGIDTNFAIARVYSIDGNYTYDFKANHKGDVNAVLPSEQLVFNYGYFDLSNTQINRYITPSIETTTPMRICAPYYQQFYEQQFVASTPRDIILYNYVANCYEMEARLSYLSANNYGLTTYTTNKQFYLYTFENGIKTLFSLIDGGIAQAYNIDIILLTKTRAVYHPGTDGLGVIPLINPITGNADLNVLSISYQSTDGNNTAATITITANSTTLYSQTFNDANSANAFVLNWNYTGIPGIDSTTWFTVQVNAVNANGDKTASQVINSAGNEPKINYTFGSTTFRGNVPIVLSLFAVILSSLFFLFGISIVSTGHTFGTFGILVCLFCIGLLALAVQVWYVGLLIAFYVGVLFFLLLARPRQTVTMG